MKFLIMILFCTNVFASDKGIDYISYSFENDSFQGADDGYTNGFILNWGHDEINSLTALPTAISYLADKTYLPGLEGRKYAVHYTAEQLIQTSGSIKEAELAVNDAPYAGLLAFDVGVSAFNADIIDEINLTVGIVGPLSGAEHTQKGIHSVIGANEPMGWGEQLSNEPVFRLESKRVWRNYATEVAGVEMDIITGAKAGFGNLRSDVVVGAAIRFGHSLDKSFLSSTPFAVKQLDGLTGSTYGWNVFANVSGSYVLNDIFLSGNTFSDSHSVDITPFQNALSIGAQLALGNWSVVYALTYGTDEYESQTDKSQFGRLSLTYQF